MAGRGQRVVSWVYTYISDNIILFREIITTIIVISIKFRIVD
jgi:hypothetical protein